MRCFSFANLSHFFAESFFPCGERYITREPSLFTLRIAFATGSGCNTMPGPPPKGRSSTRECLSSEKYIQNLTQDLYDANEIEIRGTPTYIINQTKLEGVITQDFWNEIILEKLKQ